MEDAPLVEVDTASSVPVYRQIADAVRDHCVRGRLQPGHLLPPVRQLAQDLGVHFNTVAQAYRVLADEGWLDLRRRRGALVVYRAPPTDPDPDRVDDILKRMKHLAAELRREGLSARDVALAVRRLGKEVQ